MGESCVLIWTYKVLWYSCVAAEVCLFAKIIITGLFRIYPGFAVWLLVDLAGTGGLTLVSGDERYKASYVVITLLEAGTQMWLAIEAFRAHHSHYRTRRFGTALLLTFAGVGILASAIPLFVELKSPDYGWEKFAIVGARAVSSAVAVFLVVAGWIFSRASVNVRPNVLAIEKIGAGYFLSVSILLFGVNLTAGKAGMAMNIALQAASLLFMAMWFFTLSRAGETVPQRMSPEEAVAASAMRPGMREFLKSFRWSPSKGLHGKH